MTVVSVKDKITVLMIDNEPLMIDRRIILEGKSLVNAGYNVVLATKGMSTKDTKCNEFGVKIYKFASINKQNRIRNFLKKVVRVLNRNQQKLRNYLYILAVSVLAYLPVVRTPLVKLRNYCRYPFQIVSKICKNLTRKISLLRLPVEKAAPSDYFSGCVRKLASELKPQVIHVHDLPNLKLGSELASDLNIPLIYDAHELYPMQYFTNDEYRLSLASLERELIVHVDAIVAVNSQCKEVLSETYPSVSNITILSNATEVPEHFDPKVKTRLWHNKFKLDAAVKILVFQGGINPIRYIDHLMQAMVHIDNNIHVGFITYAKDIPYYRELTKKLNISNRVHYIVEIPWDEVAFWLSAADVGIMPYQANNFNAKISSPNKLFEFVTAGLPIIGSAELVNVKAAIEQHGLGVCHLLKEVDSYVHAINQMFDPELGGETRFIDNVMAARHLFTWENEEPQLLNLYSEIQLPSKRNMKQSIHLRSADLCVE